MKQTAYALRDKVTKNWIRYDYDSEVMQFFESTIPDLYEKEEELERLKVQDYVYTDLKYASGYTHIGPDALEIVEVEYQVKESI